MTDLRVMPGSATSKEVLQARERSPMRQWVTIGRQWLADAAAVTVIVVTAAILWLGPQMARPLTLDEFTMVERYTWAGTQPNGELRELRRVTDFYSLPAPGLKDLAIGVYCAAGRWTEPGNHILNSLITNFALAFSRSERAVRFSAFTGAVTLALALYAFVSRTLGWRDGAPVLIACLLWLPYLTKYATTARGYSWMLTLQVLLLIGIHQVARRPASILWGAVCAATAVVSFMNTVNLVIDWVLPVYLIALLFPGRILESVGPVMHQDVRVTFRKNVSVQLLAIAASATIFIVDRLPYLYSSSLQYGLPTTTLSALQENAGQIVVEFFGRGLGMVLALAGLAGFFLLWGSKRHRALIGLCLGVLVVSGVHFLGARTLPPPRTSGFLMLVPLLGLGFLLQRLFEMAKRPSTRAGLLAACVVAVLALVIGGVRSVSEDDADAQAFWASVRSFSRPGVVTYPFIPNDLIDLVKYSPEEWLDAHSRLPLDEAVQMCVFTYAGAHDGGIRLRGLYGSTSMGHAARAGLTAGLSDIPKERVWYPATWEGGPPGIRTGRHHLVRITGRTESLASAEASVPARALVFWYPDHERIGIGAADLLAHVEVHGLRYVLRSVDFQVKVARYNRLGLITFVSETRQEFAAISQALRTGQQRFGGTAVVFRPHSSNPEITASS